MSDFEKYWEENASKDSWANKAVAWNIWKEKQSKIDELEKLRGLDEMAINQIAHANQQWQLKCGELQKRVDAVKGLAQTLWGKSEEKHQQGKVWESKTLGECADEILDVLEQALKGGE